MEFLTTKRLHLSTQAPVARTRHSKEFVKPPSDNVAQAEAKRCMQCGTPFCRSACPLKNDIPTSQLEVAQGKWQQAYERLRQTNPFPEFTGRVCPAPCESACTLGLIREPVAIESLEFKLADQAVANGWLKPMPPKKRRSKKVAVIGSGPAGLAAAFELNQRGFLVTIFERSPHLGGLLRNGIPNFKLDKNTVQNRIDILEAEGIRFVAGVEVGTDISKEQIKSDFQAIVLATGATQARRPEFIDNDQGVLFADYFLAGHINKSNPLIAKGKKVVIIGGGDTGSDCVGTAKRQGAASIHQIEIQAAPTIGHIYPRLKDKKSSEQWPEPMRTHQPSSSQEEGCTTLWKSSPKKITRNHQGEIESLVIETGINTVTLACDLIIIAAGYEGAPTEGIASDLGITFDSRNRAQVLGMRSSQPGVYAAGDLVRGANLVVQAIADGLAVAERVAEDLSQENRQLL